MIYEPHPFTADQQWHKDGQPAPESVETPLDPHESSAVKCDLCGHEWVAVRPAGLTKLECPNCGNIGYFENI
jgi:hypothetical protein